MKPLQKKLKTKQKEKKKAILTEGLFLYFRQNSLLFLLKRYGSVYFSFLFFTIIPISI